MDGMLPVSGGAEGSWDDGGAVRGRQPGDTGGGGRRSLPVFDVTVANPARMWDYWLGGKDNFAVDREAALSVQQALPSMPDAIQRCRAFLRRSIHTLAADHGIRQFLDIGAGLPTAGNVHEVAQQVAPSSRIVYVDFDPVVASHAGALLSSHPRGRAEFVRADPREPEVILSQAAVTLEFSRPAAVVLANILHFIPDADDPCRIVGQLMGAVPPGSFLVIVHGASDIRAEAAAEGVRRYNVVSSTPLTFRSREQVTRFFDGLELLDAGRGPGQLGESGGAHLSYFGIGRKP
jgi:S-adenosyl methyltransferase